MKHSSLIVAGVAWGISLIAAAWLGQRMAAPSSASAPSTLTTERVLASEKSAAEAVTSTQEASTLADQARSTAEAASRSITSIMDMDDPVDRMAAFLDHVRSLHSNEEFEKAALELTENFDPRGRGRELGILMATWAKSDPTAALTAASERFAEWPGRMATGTVLATWSKTDPTSAKAWALEKGAKLPTDDGNWYLTSVIAGLATKDLSLAATWAQEQPRSKARGEMIDKLLDAFGKQRGLPAAQEWLTGLDAGPFRDGATRRLAARLSDKDPITTATWITSLPAGDGKSGAMSELISRWSEKDPNAAGLWLKDFAPSKETDDPRTAFAWNIREKDPESAIAWAGTISDQARRDKTLVDLVRDWNKRDAKGAQDYMLRNQWPEAAQKKALN